VKNQTGRRRKPSPQQARQTADGKRPSQGKASATPPSQIVHTRNSWYRDSFRIVTMVLLGSIALNFVQGAVIGYHYTHPVPPKYFASTSDGRLIEIVALDKPNMSSSSVAQWAVRAINEIYSFDYARYKDELNGAGTKYFTPEGFKEFVHSMKSQGVLDTVIKKRLVVKTVVTSAPALEDEGLHGGVYTWKFTVPVIISYQSASIDNKREKVVTISVKRVPETNSSRGLAVSEFIIN